MNKTWSIENPAPKKVRFFKGHQQLYVRKNHTTACILQTKFSKRMLNETTKFRLCDVYGHADSTQNVRTFKILMLHIAAASIYYHHGNVHLFVSWSCLLYVEKLMGNKDQTVYLCANSRAIYDSSC